MLLRNSLWHLGGSAVPALVALATVPVLIGGLGLEGFGIVTLVASVVGYAGLLDINLSAGSIKYLAHYHAQDDRARFAQTFWFGLMFYGVLGVAGAGALWALSPVLLQHFFPVSPALQDDTRLALQLAALGFAVSQLQNYLMVVPQALQRYDRAAQGEAGFGVLANVLSAAVAAAGGGIAGVIVARVAVSALHIGWLAQLLRRLQLPLAFARPGTDVIRLLAHFSAYAYLSRLASLLHLHADKLIVGTLAGPVALAFYTVPVQLAGRILGLTQRMASVVFPRVSALAATGEHRQLHRLYLDATRLLTYLNLAVLGVIALCGDAFLHRWVGPDFIATGYPVLLLVTLALLADALTHLPSLVNDGLGHPHVTGRFALARGLIGVPLVAVGTVWGGIVGAALAHLCASVLMTTLFLVVVHGRTVPVTLGQTLREAWLPSAAISITVLLALLPLKWLMPDHVGGLVMLVTMAIAALTLAGVLGIASDEERSQVLALTRRWIPGAR